MVKELNIMDEREQLVFSIIDQFLRMVNKLNSKEASDYGTGEILYTSEIHVIETIGKNEGINITELATRASVTKSAISQTVTKLVRKKMIHKYKGKGNDKEVLLALAEKGKIAFAAHEAQHQNFYTGFAELWDQIPIDKLKDLKQVTDTFERSANNVWG